MADQKLRTQFRVRPDLYARLEELRQDYERYRLFHRKDARRVSTDQILRTILEHAGIVPRPHDAAEARRHEEIMRIISRAQDKPHPPDAGAS